MYTILVLSFCGHRTQAENENAETLDIFEPAMHNLFDTSRIVIDAALDGGL